MNYSAKMSGPNTNQRFSLRLLPATAIKFFTNNNLKNKAQMTSATYSIWEQS
jgi:hypothetical protein